MKFISIETISNICSVSLFENNKIKDIIESSDDILHSKNLPLLFNEIVDKNKLSLKSLDFIATSIGPGSYTGIKVGVNFSKGIAYGLDIPIIPVNSFDSINTAINNKGRYYIALYSHKDYIYYQEFKDGFPCTDQMCDTASALKDYMIYGYQLNKINNLKYIEIYPSSENVGNFAISNYKKLATKDYDIISSICITKVN
tara:strand:- start:361 stop:957 length:597 start_codon:yes stop_codon:yes gene_type:complete